MKSTIKLIFAAAVVALSACQKEEASAPSNFPKDGVIRVATNVEIPTTRGGITTDNLRMFSINIENKVNATYSYFGIFEKENDVWNCYADVEKKPLTMLWQNNIQPITVTAVSRDNAPLEQKDFAEAKMAVEPIQIDEKYFKSSDILYMAPTVIDPAKAEDLTTDGKIPVTFKHLLSKVNLSLTLGTEFNIAPGTTTNPINNLNINGTKRYFSWAPLKNGTLEVTGDKTASIIPLAGAYTAGSAATATTAATKAVATYEAILVPQTVAGKGFSVSFVIGGKPYKWTSNDAIILEQGKQHTLALTVGKDAVTLSGFTVSDWEVGGGITGGKAATPLYIDASTQITDELLAKYIFGGKLALAGTATDVQLLAVRNYIVNNHNSVTELDYTLLASLSETPDLFSNCTSLVTVKLPASAQVLYNSFQQCSKLTTIEGLGNVEALKGQVFAGCTSLTSVNCPKATTLHNWLFNGCTNLTEIRLTAASFTTIYSFLSNNGITHLDPFTNCQRESVTLYLNASQEGRVETVGGKTLWKPLDQFVDLYKEPVVLTGFKAVYCGDKKVYPKD